MPDARLSAHEAGHLTVASTCPLLSSASSRIDDGASLLTLAWAPIADHDDRSIDALTIHMAGMAGEVVAFGEPSREGLDLDLAAADEVCKLLRITGTKFHAPDAQLTYWIMKGWQTARFPRDHDPWHRDYCVAALARAIAIVKEQMETFERIRKELLGTNQARIPLP